MKTRLVFAFITLSLFFSLQVSADTDVIETANALYALASREIYSFKQDNPDLFAAIDVNPNDLFEDDDYTTNTNHYDNLAEKDRQVVLKEAEQIASLVHEASLRKIVDDDISLWEPDFRRCPPYSNHPPCVADDVAEKLWVASRLLQWRAWDLLVKGKETEAVDAMFDLWKMGQSLDSGYSPVYLNISCNIRQSVLDTLSDAIDLEGMDEAVIRKIHDHFKNVDIDVFDRGRWMRQVIRGHLYQLRCQIDYLKKLPEAERKEKVAKELKDWLDLAESEEEKATTRKVFNRKLDFLLSKDSDKRILQLKKTLEKAADLFDLEFKLSEKLPALWGEDNDYYPFHIEVLGSELFKNNNYSASIARSFLVFLKWDWEKLLESIKLNHEWQNWQKNVLEGKDLSPAEKLLRQWAGGDKKAFKELEKLAGKNDRDATEILATLYWEGKKVPEDLQKALALFKETAASGSVYSQIKAGDIIAREPEAMEEAMKYYKLASLKDPVICDQVLKYFLKNDPEDKSGKALELAKKASLFGWKLPQMILGCALAEGKGIPKDQVEAMKWFISCESFAKMEKGYYPDFLYEKWDKLTEELLMNMSKKDLLEARRREYAFEKAKTGVGINDGSMQRYYRILLVGTIK